MAIILVVAWVFPLAVNLVERLAVLGFLFVLLNVIALRIQRFSWSALFGSFLTRPKPRKRRKPEASSQQETPEAEAPGGEK